MIDNNNGNTGDMDTCVEDGDDDDDGDDENPLLWIGGNDGVESLMEETTFSARRKRAGRRDWGIPTFHDQVDRGVNFFQLRKLDDGENPTAEDSKTTTTSSSITVHLEHRKHSTASDLWDSALVLVHNLSRVLDPLSQGRGFPREASVIELGAGTGAVGLFCAKCLGAHRVVLTDLPGCLSLLERNKLTNGFNDCDQVTILGLDWTHEQLPPSLPKDGFDIILGSDLFLPFAGYLLRPLARTLYKLLSVRTNSVAILVYEERFDCSDFFVCAQQLGLLVQTVDNSTLHPTYQDPNHIFVLRITLSPVVTS